MLLSHPQPTQPALKAVFPSFMSPYLSRQGYCYVSTGLADVL